MADRIDTVDLQEGQIIQRADEAKGVSVTVNGRAGWKTRRVESASIGAGAPLLKPDAWSLLDANVRFGRFHGTVNVVPGWNELYLRTAGDSGWYAHPLRIGVGEVFLVAGQSNASGKGLSLSIAGPDVRLGEVDSSGGITWKSGSDPQVPGGGGSVWPEVGNRLTRRLGVPVAFVNVAVEASFIADWRPGSANYERLKKALLALGPASARAILWHQGESDAGTSEAEYYAGLKRLITSLAEETHRPVRWMVATASFDGSQQHSQVRVAQRRICADGFASQGPDTDVLGPDQRDRSRVHFNTQGTSAAAALWDQAIAKELLR